MLHGDHNGVVTVGNRGAGQAVALCAQYDSKARLGAQRGVINADGAAVQRHGGSFKAERVQAGHPGLGPVGRAVTQRCPRHLEHRAHADADGTAAERVAAGRREQHRVHAQCGGPAEDGPDVGGIHDALQHRDAVGVSAQCLDAARLRTAHGAEHTPGQRVAGQGLQHAAVRGVDGGVGTAGQHSRGGAVDLAALHQKGERFAPGVQRRADDLGAFGDEDTLFGLQLIAQLGLGEPGVRSQLGGG